MPEQTTMLTSCGWCGAGLLDADGQLRADVFTGVLQGRGHGLGGADRAPAEFIYVCYEGCGAYARQSSPVDSTLTPAAEVADA